MMERERNEGQHFTNEIVMNEYTLREILFAIWKYKAGRNKLPVVIYLLAVFTPAVYALVTGNEDYMLLMAVIGLSGLVCLLVYVGIIAWIGAKKREKILRQTIEKYGKEAVFKIDFGEEISYYFSNTEKTVDYREIKKVIELEMYLILRLENGMDLPVWKAGFTYGKWDDFIPYFKQKMGMK